MIQEQQVTQVLLVLRVTQVQLVQQVLEVQVLLESKGKKVTEETLVVLQVILVYQDLLDQLEEVQGILDQLALLALQVAQGQLDPQGVLEPQDQQEALVLQAPQGILDPQVLMAIQVIMEKLAPQV